MALQSLNLGSLVFNSIGQGRYMNSNVTFGDPRDFFTISGGTYNKKTGLTTASVSRTIEKEVANAGGGTSVQAMSVQVIIQVPVGFNTTEIDTTLQQSSTLVTGELLERILQGEE